MGEGQEMRSVDLLSELRDLKARELVNRIAEITTAAAVNYFGSYEKAKLYGNALTLEHHVGRRLGTAEYELWDVNAGFRLAQISIELVTADKVAYQFTTHSFVGELDVKPVEKWEHPHGFH